MSDSPDTNTRRKSDVSDIARSMIPDGKTLENAKALPAITVAPRRQQNGYPRASIDIGPIMEKTLNSGVPDDGFNQACRRAATARIRSLPLQMPPAKSTPVPAPIVAIGCRWPRNLITIECRHW